MTDTLEEQYFAFTTLQVEYWNYTIEQMKEQKVDSTNLKLVCAKAAQFFLTLESVQSYPIQIGCF